MKQILSLVLLICAIVCNKAMADVDIFVHIPVETTGSLAGNPDPAKAPYIWDQDGYFGAYPGVQMTNACKVNDVIYYYVTIPSKNSVTIKLSNGNSVEEGNSVMRNVSPADNSKTNHVAYFFWNPSAPTSLVDFYPIKVYVGAPLTKNSDDQWVDPNDANVYVWFKDDADSSDENSMCGTDNYPASPGVPVTSLPVEELFGRAYHYFVYKHHTDDGPMLQFTDGLETPVKYSVQTETKDGYVYTYTVGDDAIAVAGRELQLPIDATNFPDDTFRTYVSSKFDANNDGYLSSHEVNNIRNIDIPKKADFTISDLTGLEYFTQLRTLNVSSQSLGANGLWMLKDLPFLLILQAQKCGLSTLSLPNHPNLQVVNVGENDFTSLDFSNCPSLREFYAYNCTSLTSLDMTGCDGLAKVQINKCSGLKDLLNSASSPLKGKSNMTHLNINDVGVDSRFDFSSYTQLVELAAEHNNFGPRKDENNPTDTHPGLDFTDTTVLPCLHTLTFIDLEGCNISVFPFSNYPKLQTIKFYSNNLTTVDFSSCVNLVDVGINSNHLDMDILDMTPSKNTLKSLHADLNYNIRGIDVTGCTVLTDLFVHRNALDKLDVTTCSALKVLNCGEQKRGDVRSLKSLDLSGNPVLQRLDCNQNDFTALDVTPCKATLIHLNFSDNKVENGQFVYTECNNILSLNTSKNPQLGYVNTDNMTNLSNYTCDDTGISRLDVSKNRNLQILSLIDNTTLDELILPDYSDNIGNMGKDNRKGITQLNCYNCNLSTLDLRGNPVDGAFRVYDNRFTHLDLTDYEISKGNNTWNYTRLNAQYPILPAVVVVENDENENDIVYYYTIEMPNGFDYTKATIDPTMADKVSWLIDKVNNKTYFKIPEEQLQLKLTSGRDYHFAYKYVVPLNSKTPEYDNRNVVDMYVQIIYPEPKYQFSGVHMSEFIPTRGDNGENKYSNKITLKPTTNMLETDLGVVYKLKRFKMKEIEVTDGETTTTKIHEHFDENVASMILEKIDTNGEFAPENLHWRVKIGDADDPQNTNPFSEWISFNDSKTFTDVLYYGIADDLDWFKYRYNVVRDLNGSLFDVPVYSGVTQADFKRYTLEEVMADTDHSLSLPNAADVALTHNVEEGKTVTPSYRVNQSSEGTAENEGSVDVTLDSNGEALIHGVIGVEGTDGVNTFINEYGTLPVKLFTYDVTASPKNLFKGNETFNGGSCYFWYNLDVMMRNGEEDVNAECVGFRVWHTLPEADRDEEFADLAGRTDDYLVFDNVSGDFNDISVSDAGTDMVEYTDGNGNTFSFSKSTFGSKNPNPQLNVLVRAYYRITEGGDGPSKVSPKGDVQQEAKYIVAEHPMTISFSGDIATDVSNALADEVVSVRYLDLNGRVSNKPFGGATLKIITHANGKVTKQLLK